MRRAVRTGRIVGMQCSATVIGVLAADHSLTGAVLLTALIVGVMQFGVGTILAYWMEA